MTTRLRITFSKQGALRYIGHLDLRKLWESAARRAGIALAYSQGFHPQPKIQFASALPLGFSSRCEMVDVWVENQVSEHFQSILQAALPPGITLQQITQVDERAPALQTQVTACEFDIILLDSVDVNALTRRLSAVLQAGSILRERRGKPYDLRPLIESLAFCAAEMDASPAAPRLYARLTAREGATGRPEEVLDELGITLESARIERAKLILTAAQG